MFRVTYKKEGEPPVTPIREYQIKYCLPCENEGKCDFDQMLLCATIRSMNYAEELYGLKKMQMDAIEEHRHLVEDRMGSKNPHKTTLDEYFSDGV